MEGNVLDCSKIMNQELVSKTLEIQAKNIVASIVFTYDHRVWRTGLPVRSAVLKPHAGRLVVWWVTTCESLLFLFLSFVEVFALCGYLSTIEMPGRLHHTLIQSELHILQ
ncbi:hypothetical protein VI817_001715 [Penicillium citrinum]|nr:hypothetical protein VI817_001715 [Penicillium citrinum]